MSDEENPQVVVIMDNPILVTTDTPPETDPVSEETKALIQAIQTKAFSEAQKAGDFARESYLEFIREAREQVENLNLFEPDRIEDAMKQLQVEVEKDWINVVSQFKDFGFQFNNFGDRLNEAAKAAWDILTQSDKN